MKKVDVKLSQSYRLLNPGCVVLVSVGDGTEDNLFPVTWNMPIRKEPPMVALMSGKRHYSYPFIERTGEFGINIPDASIVDPLLGCGLTTGHKEKDKYERFGLTRQSATHIRPPLVEEAVANLECRVCQVVDLGSSALLLGQIVGAVASPDHFADGEFLFEKGLQLIHHLGGRRFAVSDKVIDGKKPTS